MPAYLSDLMPTALALIAGQTDGIRAEVNPRARPGAVDHLVVWLIDGLGWDQLTQALDMGIMPHLQDRLRTMTAHVRPLQTVNPSMTPVALASLLTGADPARHGLLGQALYHGGQTVNAFKDPWPKAMALAAPTIKEVAEEVGIPCRAILEHGLLPGALTQLLHGNGPHVLTYVRDSGLAAVTNAVLAEHRRGLVYLYSSGIDAINHRRGAYTPEWEAEIAALDRHLASLAGPAGDRTWLWITADHGHIPMRGDLPYADLVAGLPWLPERPAQVGTAVSVNVHDMAALRLALSELSPYAVEIVPSADWGQSGYFGRGDVSPFLSRLGNHMLVPESGVFWGVEPGKSFCWSHGGMDPAEMTVPWIEVRL